MTEFTPVGTTTELPTFTDGVDQNFFVEPLSGPINPTNYLDRFPDSIYNKAPDTHFVRFMYTLLGPAGIGWLKKNFLEGRLYLTEHGFEVFDMERYYANPFRFGRVLAEQFEEDPTGTLNREQWNKIKFQDEAYRSRAIEFFNAARAGNTPFGMELAAQSGLGHNAEVIENYKALFDANSDEPKGFEYAGSTRSTSEFVIVPRLNVSRSEQQKIEITGSPTGGSFTLVLDGQSSSALPYFASAPSVQDALQGISSIGEGNVEVRGGAGTTSLITTTNLATNPSFETDLTGWTNSGSTFTRSSDRALNGDYSAKVVTTAGGQGIKLPLTGLTIGNTYQVSVSVYSLTSFTFLIKKSYEKSFQIPPARWTRCNYEFVASATSHDVYFNNITEAAVTYYLDSAMVTSGSVAYDYFDGGFFEWGWNGTEHASTSTGPVGTLLFAPYIVTFKGNLAGQNVNQLKVFNGLTGGVSPDVKVTTIADGIPVTDEEVVIAPELQHNLQKAIDLLRPVNSMPTISSGSGTRTTQSWKSVTATSEYQDVLRFVTGNSSIEWPVSTTSADGYWVEPGKEKEAPRIRQDIQHNYVGFHDVEKIIAYTDIALEDPTEYKNGTTVNYDGSYGAYTSEHVGEFNSSQVAALPIRFGKVDPLQRLTADMALADYAEPLNVTTQIETNSGTINSSTKSLINGIYPADYTSLQNTPTIKYKDEQFWASLERTAGNDYLEIDLGHPQAVNFITFEITNKPFEVDICYDALDAAPKRNFVSVTPALGKTFPRAFKYSGEASSPWSYAEYNFTDSRGQIPMARFIRISFSRSNGVNILENFLYDPITGIQSPFSVEVKNVRIGRNAN